MSAAAPGSPSDAVQLCTFVVGGQEYAVDIARVGEILPPQTGTPLPGAPAHIRGVLQVRGEVVPLVDARARLGGPAPASTRRAKVLLTRIGTRHLALQVDEVRGVLALTRGDLRPPPGGHGRSPYVLGVCGPADALRLLLDVKALLREAP